MLPLVLWICIVQVHGQSRCLEACPLPDCLMASPCDKCLSGYCSGAMRCDDCTCAFQPNCARSDTFGTNFGCVEGDPEDMYACELADPGYYLDGVIVRACLAPVEGCAEIDSTTCSASVGRENYYKCLSAADGYYLAGSALDYAIQQEVVVISGCPAGQEPDGEECIPCDAGEFSNTNSVDECQVCPAGQYSGPAAVECEVCPIRATSPYASISITNCTCERDAYQTTPDSTRACLPCVEGAVCAGGAQAPVADAGYYSSASSSVIFVRCPERDACLGKNQCAEGHEGARCTICSGGYYQLNGRCEKCSSSVYWQIPFGIVVGLVVAVISVYMGLPSKRPTPFTPVFSLAVPGIVVTFLQTSALYLSLDIPWPPAVRAILGAFSALNFNFQLVQPECVSSIDYFAVWRLKMVSPLLIVLLFIIIGIVLFMLELKKGADTTLWDIVHKLSAALLFYLMLTYVMLAKAVLGAIVCDEDVDGARFLRDDPSVSCDGGAYEAALPWAILACFVYVVGIPLVQLGTLWGVEWRHGRSGVLVHPLTAFAAEKYESRFFWIDGLILLRKSAVVLGVFALSGALRFTWLFLVQIFAVLFLAVLSPYTILVHDVLEFLLILTNALTLVLGDQLRGDNVSTSARQTISRTLTTLLILSFLAIFVCIILELKYKVHTKLQKDAVDVPAREDLKEVPKVTVNAIAAQNLDHHLYFGSSGELAWAKVAPMFGKIPRAERIGGELDAAMDSIFKFGHTITREDVEILVDTPELEPLLPVLLRFMLYIGEGKPNVSSTGNISFRVVFDFFSDANDELNVSKGDVVQVVSWHPIAGNQWLLVSCDGEEGLVPKKYLEAMSASDKSEMEIE